MVGLETPELQSELEQIVRRRTGRRVRNLRVELAGERVILRGQATSYYVKQLAQHGIFEILPRILLENTIDVEMRPIHAA